MTSRPADADPADPAGPGFGNPLLDDPVLPEGPVPLTMSRRTDLVGALLIAAVGVLVLVLAFTYPTPAVVFDAIGPMGFPKVIGSFLVIGGLVLAVNTARRIRQTGWWAAEEGTEDEPDHPSSGRRALVVMAGSFGYLALLPSVGFEILTPIGIALALWALDYRTWAWRAVVGTAFTVFAFVVFGIVLGVPLPHGPLEDLLLSLGLVSF